MKLIAEAVQFCAKEHTIKDFLCTCRTASICSDCDVDEWLCLPVSGYLVRVADIVIDYSVETDACDNHDQGKAPKESIRKEDVNSLI